MTLPIITVESLRGLNACEEGVKWFKAQNKKDLKEVCYSLVEEKKGNWANWLLVRYLSRDDKVRYGIYAAEKVLHIYENRYPTDLRPRNAIEAARDCLKKRQGRAAGAADATGAAARAAAFAAAFAADATYAAGAAAATAAGAAADAAAFAAAFAADATYAADAAADAAAFAAAADDAATARKKLQLEIIDYGISLLEKEPNAGTKT